MSKLLVIAICTTLLLQHTLAQLPFPPLPPFPPIGGGGRFPFPLPPLPFPFPPIGGGSFPFPLPPLPPFPFPPIGGGGRFPFPFSPFPFPPIGGGGFPFPLPPLPPFPFPPTGGDNSFTLPFPLPPSSGGWPYKIPPGGGTPSPPPISSSTIQQESGAPKCWSSLTKIEGCVQSIQGSIAGGKASNLGAACCQALMEITEDCMSQMFPQIPAFPSLLKEICTKFGDGAPAPKVG